MAITYTALASLLQTYLENQNDDFIAAIPTIVRQAEDRIYKAVQIPALKKNQTGTCTASNKYLTLPSDFLATYSVAVTANSSMSYLLEREVSWLAEAMSGVANGVPRYYALFDENTYLLGPTPASGYSMELHYFYKPASIVDTNTSWLGNNAENALLYAALVEGYIYLKGEPDVLAMYQTRLNEAILALKNLGEGRDKTDNFKADQPRMAPQ